MRDVIVEFSYDRFLVGHTNGLDYHYIAFTHCLHRNVTAVTPHCNVLYAVSLRLLRQDVTTVTPACKGRYNIA